METTKKHNPMLLFVALLLACSFHLRADDAAVAVKPDEAAVAARGEASEEPQKRVVRLGEVLVVGSREQRNLLETTTLESESLDIATSVVDSEAMRARNSATLADALDLSTGVFTERRGRKEKALSSFRGQIYPYPDFAINGVWQRAFWEVPAFFPATAIDRIEVLRSGGAIMAGPNAGLVGTINIVPRRFDKHTTILDAQAGSYETFRSSIVTGDRLENADYTVGASIYRTAGPKGENAAEQFSSVFGTASWAPSDSLSFELTGFGLFGYRELRLIQEPGNKPLRTRLEKYSPYNSYGGVLRTLWKHDNDSSTSLDLGYVRRDADFHSFNPNKTEDQTTINEEKDWEYNAGLMHAHKLSKDNTLRLGVQYNHWESPNGKRHFVGDPMDVHTFSGVITDEHQWERLTLDGGIRLTRSWYDEYTERTFNIAGDNLSGNKIWHEWSKPAFTGTLGSRYLLADAFSIYAHAAFGTLDVPTGVVSENDNKLDRENRLILDAGVMLGSPETANIKAGVFGIYRSDALLLTSTRVTVDDDTFNTYENTNIRQYGLEIEGRTPKFMEIFLLFANITIMDAERREDGEWTSYKEIPHIVATYGLNLAIDRFDANLYCKHVSAFENRRFADDGQYHDLGDFADLGMTAGYSLGCRRQTRVYISLENMINNHYQTVVGYPDYGFQAFAGLQYQM